MKQFMLFSAFLIIFPSLVIAASPMIEKHIFLPEKVSENKSMLTEDAIQQKLEFTGVVISDKGRFAFIKEMGNKKEPGVGKKIYKEGDEISGAVISQIAPNYLVLLNNGKKIKVKLFSGNKKRPASPVTRPQNSAGAQPAGGQPANTTGTQAPGNSQKNNALPKESRPNLDQKIRESENAKENNIDKASNPFTEALKKAMETNKNTKPVSNPFLEAIKRAQNKK